MDLQLPESDEGAGDTELRELLSDCQHEIWAHWMRYLFYTSIPLDDGGVKITAENFQRWQRQAVTPYSELSEREKDSDREQADKVLMVLGQIDILRESLQNVSFVKIFGLEGDYENNTMPL